MSRSFGGWAVKRLHGGSRPAILQIKQAVGEITKTARRDPVRAADAAVLQLERISPALENVDSSSTATHTAVAQLVPIIAEAPADERTRPGWLERLWVVYNADGVPSIEQFGDDRGELCASKQLAASWAKQLVRLTRLALSPTSVRGLFCGTSACVSALYRAEQYQAIVELVSEQDTWTYTRWVVNSLAGMRNKSEAIRYAEASRGSSTGDFAVDRVCEEIMRSSRMADEAYRRDGLRATSVLGGCTSTAARGRLGFTPLKWCRSSGR